jgi:phosphate transport system substrate-binding protein
MGVGCSQPQITVDGSSTVYPVTEAVAEEFGHENPGVRVTVGRSGTGGGMKKFWQGEIDICDASRPISESERELCEKAGIEFIELSVCFDGLAVVVHPDNDWCDCLTVEQLKKLWEPESSVSKWSDLDPAWPAEEIKLFGPGTDSGTFDYFTEVIVGEEKASRSDYTGSEDDNMLVSGVQSDAHALGYFGYAYYEANKDRLKLLAVDRGDGNCVQPSMETVRDDSYSPLSRPLFIYVSKPALKRPEVLAFVKYYLASSAKLSSEVGYVPVSDEVAAENEAKLAEVLGGEPVAAN